MNKILISLFIILCAMNSALPRHCHHNRGKDFGVSFGGSVLGSAVGSAIGTAVGNAVSQPSSSQKVVVVKEIHEVPAKTHRRERLESQIRAEIGDLHMREDELVRELKKVRIALEEKERTLRRIKESDADVEIEII